MHIIWLEHYPRDPRACLGAAFRRVSGVRHPTLDRPHWSPGSRAAVEALIGSQSTEQRPLPRGGDRDEESQS